MRFGVLSGCLWGLDTVVLGIALAFSPFLGSEHASLTSALLHDVLSALILLVYMGMRGRLRDTLAAARTRSGKAVMIGAVMGGPVGMSGYLIAINSIGPGYTAIISTFYPAVGTLLAYLLLKERMRPRQIVALMVALAAVILIGWSSSATQTGDSPLLGVIAALACVFGWGSEAVILAWGMRDDKVDNETALHIRQTTSGLTYLVVVAPAAQIVGFTVKAATSAPVGIVLLAALAGAASYLFYFQAIGQIGASRGMALNISYSAWAVLFALVMLGTVPSLLQVVCCVVILVGTVLAATPDWNELRPRRSRVPREILNPPREDDRDGGEALEDAPAPAPEA